MATRSTIALEFADGTVAQVYCHWDGYLDHNGRILLDHYTDPFKLQKLIDIGNLSVLAKEIGERHPFDNPGRYGSSDWESYNQKYKDWCKFYGRDRGEHDFEARYFGSFNEYTKNAPFEEYNYILRQVNNRPVWFVAHNDSFVELEQAIEDNE